MRRRVLIGAAVAAALLALAVLAALPPRARVAGPPLDDPHVVRGALHVHTKRSDGTGTVEEVADAARRAGLQFVVLADHGDATRPPDPPTYRSGVLCLDAVEISTTAGHYVALGLDRAPYRLAGEPRDVVEDVARLGGFGIAAHPLSPKRELQWGAWDAPFDGLEWLNADSEWRDESFTAVARALATYLFRGPETIAALFDRPDDVLERWDALARTRRVVGVAGHDAHARIGLRGNWEPADGDVSLRAPSYEAAFRTFAVRVRLDAPWTGDAPADAERLLAGVRAGAAYTVIDAIASGGWLELSASDGVRTVAGGADLGSERAVTIHARVSQVEGLSLVLLRDGVPVKTSTSGALAARHEPTGNLAVYRVEAYVNGGRGGGGVPWIVSNPIRIGSPLAFESAAPLPGRVTEELPLADAVWHKEQDAWSAASVERGRAPWGAEGQRLSYELADGQPRGQYAAAVLDVARGDLPGWDQLAFRVRAAAPMRISVQVRDPAGGERWMRSVYVDEHERVATVRFSEMRPAEGEPRRVALAGVDSILFVVDTTNTAPGEAGEVWLSDVRLQRLEADQVRTVSSR
jgi:hypothetical protein